MKNVNDVSEFYDNRHSIDGFLHIPEMNLFSSSPLMPEINIHATGGKQGDYEALWHAVPSKQCVMSSMHCEQNLFRN